MSDAAKRISRRALMAGATSVSIMSEPARAGDERPRFLAGVNLAGAEFGQAMPGRHGTDYIYPSAIDVARHADLGFNAIRLPFRWERLQPDIGGDFDRQEWQRLATTIETTLAAGLTIILDVHNYARRRIRDDGFKADHMIGSAAVPSADFAAFWSELARRSPRRSKVIFGLMNEPADLDASTWAAIAQRAITDIRWTGADNLILLPGVAYSGAHSWFEAGNTVLERVEDPAANMAIEVHQYFDGDSSGRAPCAVSASIGSERIKAFEGWARSRRLKAFLGEFGTGSDLVSLAALQDLTDRLAASSDVWLGWTAWAAGPWWPPDYGLRLEPDGAGVWPANASLLASQAKLQIRAKP